jgi:ribosome-binding factor A
MISERIQRVNSLIARELGKLFLRELETPRSAVVTITKVATTADLSYAYVWISVLPNSEEPAILEYLEKNRGRLQTALNRKLVMRSVPLLSFQSDRTEEHAARVERLLDDIRGNG